MSMGLIPLSWAVGIFGVFSGASCGDSGGSVAPGDSSAGGSGATADMRPPAGDGQSPPAFDAPQGAADTSGTADAPSVDFQADKPAVADAGNASEVPVGARPHAMVWVREPNGPTFARDIFGTGENDVWTVSDNGVVRHTTGDGNWSYRNVSVGGSGRLTGVWGTAPNNVFASAYANVVVRWDGSGNWQRVGFPAGVAFEAIWGSGPDDVYAGGNSNYHLSGGTWTLRADLTSAMSISGTGPNDVWMLHGSEWVTHKGADGKWIKEATGLGLTAPGIAIWNSGPNDIYVVTGAEVAHSTGDGKWVRQPLPGRAPNETLTALWGSGPTDVYVGTARGNLFRSTGDGLWYLEKLNPAAPIDSVNALWGSSRNNVYVVAGSGMFRGRAAP
jgi:hypothetical protein